MDEKKGQQYQRTDREIRDAFLRVLNNKPFEKIRIQEILEEAIINRSTFYMHYKDKYDIAEQLVEHYIKPLKQQINEIFITESLDLDVLDRFIYDYFIENKRTLMTLMKIQTEEINITESWKQLFRENYLQSSHSETSVAEAEIYANIVMGFIIYYLNASNSLKQVSKTFHEIFKNLIKNILHEESDERAAELLFKYRSSSS